MPPFTFSQNFAWTQKWQYNKSVLYALVKRPFLGSFEMKRCVFPIRVFERCWLIWRLKHEMFRNHGHGKTDIKWWQKLIWPNSTVCIVKSSNFSSSLLFPLKNLFHGIPCFLADRMCVLSYRKFLNYTKVVHHPQSFYDKIYKSMIFNT